MSGHTRADEDVLVAYGIDPAVTQPRERAVPCHICGLPTFNVAGGCSVEPKHYRLPFVCRRMVRDRVAS